MRARNILPSLFKLDSVRLPASAPWRSSTWFWICSSKFLFLSLLLFRLQSCPYVHIIANIRKSQAFAAELTTRLIVFVFSAQCMHDTRFCSLAYPWTIIHFEKWRSRYWQWKAENDAYSTLLTPIYGTPLWYPESRISRESGCKVTSKLIKPKWAVLRLPRSLAAHEATAGVLSAQ